EPEASTELSILNCRTQSEFSRLPTTGDRLGIGTRELGSNSVSPTLHTPENAPDTMCSVHSHNPLIWMAIDRSLSESSPPRSSSCDENIVFPSTKPFLRYHCCFHSQPRR